MSSPAIADFLFDEENEEKFAAHGVSALQVLQLLENNHMVVPNRQGRRGIFLVVGRDNSGSCIAVPVEPTHVLDLWRPVTAWRCKPSELVQLERRSI